MTAATPLFAATGVAYLSSAGCSLVQLVRGGPRLDRAARVSLVVSVALHASYVVADWLLYGGHELANIHQGLVVLSLLIPVFYLATMGRHRLKMLGAFVTPITIVLFLGAGLRAQVAQVSPEVQGALLPFHVAANVLGIAAFALAFAAAVAYLIQESLLRHRRVGGVFQRLPPLDVLDAFGLRSVTIGFPLFTFGVITGTFWVASKAPMSVVLGYQGFGVLAWVCFGSVLLARLAAGWRGRRAAIGTMLGFLCSMIALGGYLLRDFNRL